MKKLFLIILLTLVCDTAYARPYNPEITPLTIEQITRIEDCVINRLKRQARVYKRYTIEIVKETTYEAANSYLEKRYGLFTKDERGLIIRLYNEWDTLTFTHELAHVYGADENKADVVEYQCFEKGDLNANTHNSFGGLFSRLLGF